MSEIAIRFAEPERDAARILEIYRPYIEKTAITFEKDVPDVTTFRDRVREIAAVYPYLLLEADGKTVGYAYAHRQAERAAFDWNAELSIYMEESWQGKGAGRPLYALLIKLLTMQGYVNLYAVITGSNAWSIAMHEHMGFHRIALHERTGFKFGAWHDTVWMHLRVFEGLPHKTLPVGSLNAEAVLREFTLTREAICTRLAAKRG